MSERLTEALQNIPASILERFARELDSCGDQCAGGSGQETVKSGPMAGRKYGEPFYEAAKALRAIPPKP